MEWTLKICGKTTRFEVLDDVTAFRPLPGVWQGALAMLPKLLAERVSDDTLHQILGRRSLFHRRVFDAAGWNFIHTPGWLLAKMMIGMVRQRHVYATERGALMIGTRLATVKLPEDMTEAQKNAAFKEDHLEEVFELKFARNLFEVRLPEGPPYPELINKLQDKTDRYIFAEPSLLETITGRGTPAVALTQKLELGNQWQHLKPGQGAFGINSLEAWTVTKGKSKNGDRPVRIAVIDNGMQISHPEIKPAIIGGGCFPADDGNAATPDFRPLPTEMSKFLDDIHGTLCMGMAGARIKDQNDLAPAGSAPEADLIAIAIHPTTTQTTLSRAIEFAVNPTKEDTAELAGGADIISCSLGTSGIDKSVLKEAVAFAKSGRNGSGTPIFWAVNNDPNHSIPSTDICSEAAVIAVGSSDRSGQPAGSSPGENLAFLAPGKGVLGIRSGDGETFGDGSSVATPLAAGVAALVLSINPNLSADALRNLLQDSCERPPGLLPGQRDNERGSGIINSANAVQKALETLGPGH